jgi:ketosteroid isomerase-like protein
VASANLDLVRSIYTDWERGDMSSAEWAAPEIEFVLADGPDPRSWRGRGGMAEGARELFRAWQGIRGEADEYRELDGERVLVLDHRHGRGKTSGLELGRMRTRGATLWHSHDGRVTKLVIYHDRDRALADLGLTSETDSSTVQLPSPMVG